jgi:hypothetical protein
MSEGTHDIMSNEPRLAKISAGRFADDPQSERDPVLRAYWGRILPNRHRLAPPYWLFIQKDQGGYEVADTIGRIAVELIAECPNLQGASIQIIHATVPDGGRDVKAAYVGVVVSEHAAFSNLEETAVSIFEGAVRNYVLTTRQDHVEPLECDSSQ